MGAEFSVYDSYSLGEAFDNNEKDIWEICPGVRNIDEEAVTVFIHDKKKDKDSKIDSALKFFRSLRHPGLLKCLELFDEDSEVTVVTEAVVPLADVVSDLYIHEVIAGVHNVIVTLAFLHDKCKLSHNNLSMESIFVGQNDACWKIAGFEEMRSFSDMIKEKSIKGSHVHAKDSLGLGKFICDVFEQVDFQGDSFITNFQHRIQEEILEASLEKRPHVTRLLDDDIFQNGYCQILDFLRNITVQSSERKATFFRTLHSKLRQLPANVIANRLLHLLLSRFVLIDPVAVEVFLPHLLTPLSENHSVVKRSLVKTSPLLPEELYKECCIPILRKLFNVNDRHVRLILLKYFHLYVGMFDKAVLRSEILPELRLCLQDSDDELVSATFSALQYLVPLLGANAVIGGERIQQFTERRPKFDSKVMSFSDLETRITKEPTLLMMSKAKPSENLQDKTQERERRREETRRRNEERRKQRQRSHMEKKLAMKASVVEHVQQVSGNEFDSWENFDDHEKDDQAEISDDSEHGRPSSSEISLDSGFSEKRRNIQEQPVSPQSFLNHEVSEVSITPKPPQGKSFGMKLGKKGKLENKDSVVAKRNNIENMLSRKGSSFETSPKKTGEINEDVLNSTEENWTFSEDFSDLSSPVKKTGRKLSSKTDSGKSKPTKDSNKNKTVSPQKVFDAPWEDFDIKVTKKATEVDDIFADMAPKLGETRTAAVKGTSMYSEKLAVSTEVEDVDGWIDDDW